jgi:hypothetical protein
MTFTDRPDWDRRHLSCPHISRPADRSTLSRTRLCGFWVAVRRCRFAKCPLRAPASPEKPDWRCQICGKLAVLGTCEDHPGAAMVTDEGAR